MPKPRDQFIYIGSDEKFDRIIVSGPSVRLPDDGRTYYVLHQREYQRARKPKTVYALFQFFGSRSILIDPVEELKQYDAVYAIDTNYARTAITTTAQAKWVPSMGIFAARKLFTRRTTPATSKPEREAWRDFISETSTKPGSHNCLVVDSDLGDLMKINRREQPVLPGFHLPLDWQLNYATSDANDDFILVRMMRMCEQANKKGKTAVYTSG